MKALHGLATHDDLTGLLNRREMERVLTDELERAERYNRPLSLVLIDLDHFKRVNDSHGHQVGDLVLRHLASLLTGQTRAVDHVARYGGEEFALIEVETDAPGALLSAERIRAGLEGSPCPVPGLEGGLSITLSAGVATYPQHGLAAESLLRAADRALYEAKARGRNRVVGAGDLPPLPA
jgi:diguanylate cyclase (GGDEF)-like protein